MAGATISDLDRFVNGEYSVELINLILAWKIAKSQISEHSEDYMEIKREKDRKASESSGGRKKGRS